ncbi:hypothetical protein [Oricola sp.]|uniref:hypothetical protein n=1 Tax=Oricola sp. TaxID=1979950 RepID=UPI0025DD30A8|nr:hypothetical protein [Oricola sp.]MCI5075574.1 hypothetical protein [Oricola sp.]
MRDSGTLLMFCFGIVVACFAGFLFGVYAGDFGRFQNWFFQHQTFVAGMIALAAAGLTVGQMQRSDDRAESRHRDVLRLTLRRDISRLIRFRETYGRDVEIVANTLLQNVDAAMLECKAHKVPTNARLIAENVSDIISAFVSEESAMIADLLDADMHGDRAFIQQSEPMAEEGAYKLGRVRVIISENSDFGFSDEEEEDQFLFEEGDSEYDRIWASLDHSKMVADATKRFVKDLNLLLKVVGARANG